MPATISRVFALAILAGAALLPSVASGQDAYRTHDEAFVAGAKFLRTKEYSKAQAPLEAALNLATDDQQRLKTYRALVPSHRLLAEIDKMLEAQEFLIRKSDGNLGRKSAAGDLASFLHQRGKTDLGIARYEEALKADASDIAALTVLSAIYSHTQRDPAKADDFKARQAAADKQLARRWAERLEKDAEAAPRTSASILKDAAAAWIEADDKPAALAAATKSLASLPEDRGDLLVYFWRRGLGDVFLAAGEPAQAILQFEAALAVVKIEGYRQDTEKQLPAAKAAAAKQP